jgi:hypothetical protein
VQDRKGRKVSKETPELRAQQVLPARLVRLVRPVALVPPAKLGHAGQLATREQPAPPARKERKALPAFKAPQGQLGRRVLKV